MGIAFWNWVKILHCDGSILILDLCISWNFVGCSSYLLHSYGLLLITCFIYTKVHRNHAK